MPSFTLTIFEVSSRKHKTKCTTPGAQERLRAAFEREALVLPRGQAGPFQHMKLGNCLVSHYNPHELLTIMEDCHENGDCAYIYIYIYIYIYNYNTYIYI